MNIARVGPYPAPGRATTGPRHWPIAISGGLYAALYNLGVKGLHWPGMSSDILLSAKAGEYPLEPHRRFATLFTTKTDKALKQKA